MMILTTKQIRFLEHVRDNHKAFGWLGTVNEVLEKGSADDFDLANLKSLRNSYIDALRGDTVETDVYGIPTKYLKIET